MILVVVLVATALSLFLVSGETSHPAFNMVTNIEGVKFREIGPCPDSAHHHHNAPDIPNSAIHIAVIASSHISDTHYPDGLLEHIENLKAYASRHSYPIHVVKPEAIINKYGALFKPGAGHRVKTSKPMIMLYTMKDIAHKYGCDAKWILFLDADVFVNDQNRRLQSLIHAAMVETRESYAYHNLSSLAATNKTQQQQPAQTHHNKHNQHQQQQQSPQPSCDIILQDAPTTLNSGVFFVRISREGEAILQLWVETLYKQIVRYVNWQEDQGWLQHLFVQHVERVFSFKAKRSFNCGTASLHLLNYRKMVQQNPLYRPPAEAAVRNWCYAKQLAYYGLPPGKRSVTNWCVLGGLSGLDRFNLHDWPGEDHWEGGKYVHRMHDSKNVLGKCALDNIFFYHGRDEQFTKQWINQTYTGDGRLHQLPADPVADLVSAVFGGHRSTTTVTPSRSSSSSSSSSSASSKNKNQHELHHGVVKFEAEPPQCINEILDTIRDSTTKNEWVPGDWDGFKEAEYS